MGVDQCGSRDERWVQVSLYSLSRVEDLPFAKMVGGAANGQSMLVYDTESKLSGLSSLLGGSVVGYPTLRPTVHHFASCHGAVQHLLFLFYCSLLYQHATGILHNAHID